MTEDIDKAGIMHDEIEMFADLLGFQLERIQFDQLTPPDDLSPKFAYRWKAYWRVNEMGARLEYQEEPRDAQLLHDVRLSVADSCLLFSRLDGNYTQAARQAWKYDKSDPLRGLFLRVASKIIVTYLEQNGGIAPTATYIYNRTLSQLGDMLPVIGEFIKGLKEEYDDGRK